MRCARNFMSLLASASLVMDLRMALLTTKTTTIKSVMKNLCVTLSVPSRPGIMTRQEKLLYQGDAPHLEEELPPQVDRSLPLLSSSSEVLGLLGMLQCFTLSLPRVPRQILAGREVPWHNV